MIESGEREESSASSRENALLQRAQTLLVVKAPPRAS
jgi:hypothetical protein